MAGPGIRCFEFAHQLSAAGHTVTLTSPRPSDLPPQAFQLTVGTVPTLLRLAREHDVVITQGTALERYPFLREGGARIVVDLYDPFPLALLEQFSAETLPHRLLTHQGVLGTANAQLRHGDFFLCASEQQRDFWLGSLTALNRVNPHTHGADRTMRQLIDVVPFGIPDVPPAPDGPAARGVIPGIEPGDVLLLWGGGIYNWFDPLTLVRAVAAASRSQPRLRLLFLSTTHPNPDVPSMWMEGQTRQLADELGLTGRHVFFNESWVPYEERARWLCEADAGVSTHFDHVETRFSFRTRILDYLWAGLPILCTRGDVLADAVERHQLGLTVPPEDVPATTTALERMVANAVDRRAWGEEVRAYARRLTWSSAVGPLLAYCERPWPAADLAAPGPRPAVPLGSAAGPGRSPGPLARELGRSWGGQALLEGRRLGSQAIAAWRTDGAAGVALGLRKWARRRRPGSDPNGADDPHVPR